MKKSEENKQFYIEYLEALNGKKKTRELLSQYIEDEKLIEHADLTMGSYAAIVACGAAKLGLKTAFVGIVGDDVFGHFMLDAMKQTGIDTSNCIVDPSLATGFSLIFSEPRDRAILTYLDQEPTNAFPILITDSPLPPSVEDLGEVGGRRVDHFDVHVTGTVTERDSLTARRDGGAQRARLATDPAGVCRGFLSGFCSARWQ